MKMTEITIYRINCPDCGNLVFDGKITINSSDIDMLGTLHCDECENIVNISKIIKRNR